MTVAAIGLGGNLEKSRRSMAAALDRLAATHGIRVAAVANLYETPPWGKTDQPAFLNSAALIETDGTARMLLDTLLGIEASLGRTRDERWGPRLVDLDILLFGTESVDEPGLHVPHPRLTERAFALLPLADLMPDFRLSGRSILDWLKDADKSGIARIAEPDWYRAGASVEAV